MENLPEWEAKPKGKNEKILRAFAYLAVGYTVAIVAFDNFGQTRHHEAVPNCENLPSTIWHQLGPNPENAAGWAKYFRMSVDQFINGAIGSVHCDSPVRPPELDTLRVSVENQTGPCVVIGYQDEANPIERSDDNMKNVLVLCAGTDSNVI